MESTRDRAVAGAVAAAAALGVAELAAAAVPRAPSLVDAVATMVIDVAPRPVVDFGISTFGTTDKVALQIGTVLVCVVAGAVAGARTRPGRPTLTAALVAFGLIGVAAALRGTGQSLIAVVAVAVAGVVAARAAFRLLTDRAAPVLRDQQVNPDDGSSTTPVRSRREFVLLAAGLAVAATAAGAAGRRLARPARAAAARLAVILPRPGRPLAPAPAGADLAVPGLAPLFTPNDGFYRIDTALTVPDVDPDDWHLEVDGMVARPFRLTYAELLALPMVEADVTIACVSNEVGGDLVGTARWQGVPLRDLLERAGVDRGADQIVGRSVDGFTAGFPVRALDDDRTALVAVAMNGEPLPLRHGFPARLVVAGLYGYVSATKWLSGIELTTFRDFDAYWIVRGWSASGPVKTQSRIDVPRPGATVPPGAVTVAGVAWAPTRGIGRVEVRVDGGAWQETELSEPLTDETWRQWRFAWDATPGRHQLEARATDGTGTAQTADRVDPYPDGATGLHRVTIRVL